MKPGLKVLRDVLIIATIVAGISVWQTKDLLSGSSPAPAVMVESPEGERVALTDVGEAAGAPKLLYFFAPWCGVCKLSMSNAQTVADWLGKERVSVVGVALDFESPAEVAAFVAEHAPGMRYYLGDATVRDAYKIAAYPTYYVLDGDDRVIRTSVGYSSLIGLLARAL